MENFFSPIQREILLTNVWRKHGKPVVLLCGQHFLRFSGKQCLEKIFYVKLYIRFVDYIFAIIKRSDADKLMQTLNRQLDYPKIKFKVVQEENGQLAFHKRLILPKVNENGMVYRMCRLPLSINKFTREICIFADIAKANGYTEQDDLVHKQSNNIRQNSLSTLFQQTKSQETVTRAPFKFIHPITNQLEPIFKHHKIQMVFSNTNKLKDLLGNPKEKLHDHQKSGIYLILCNECQKIYIGQTRRNIFSRFKEHCAHIKYNIPSKSKHVLEYLHLTITNINLKLIKSVRSARQLDVVESIQMHKQKPHLMNNVQELFREYTRQ